MNVNYFLKVLKREGYPNPDLLSIANVIDYNLDDFLPDLEKEIGNQGVLDFCEKAILKLTGENGLRINLLDDDEYVYIHIYPIGYDPDESENDIVCNHGWGESKIFNSIDDDGNKKYVTIQEVFDNAGLGEWSEIDEFTDYIKTEAYNKIFYQCGFGVWWA